MERSLSTRGTTRGRWPATPSGTRSTDGDDAHPGALASGTLPLRAHVLVPHTLGEAAHRGECHHVRRDPVFPAGSQHVSGVLPALGIPPRYAMDVRDVHVRPCQLEPPDLQHDLVR